jgi:hypothetical protein
MRLKNVSFPYSAPPLRKLRANARQFVRRIAAIEPAATDNFAIGTSASGSTVRPCTTGDIGPAAVPCKALTPCCPGRQAGPGASQRGGDKCDVSIAERLPKARHDNSRHAFMRANATQNDLDQVGGIGQAQCAVEREIRPHRERRLAGIVGPAVEVAKKTFARRPR